MCYMTYSSLSRHKYECVMRRIRIQSPSSHMRRGSFTRWQNSFTCVPWLVHMCDMTLSNVTHLDTEPFLHICDMAPSHVDITHSHVCHDSSTCVTWLFQMWHIWIQSPSASNNEEQPLPLGVLKQNIGAAPKKNVFWYCCNIAVAKSQLITGATSRPSLCRRGRANLKVVGLRLAALVCGARQGILAGGV